LLEHALPFKLPAPVHLPKVCGHCALSVQAFCEHLAVPGSALQSDFFVQTVALSWQVIV
jgi:hypothetical protein